jgi:flagellar assembly factor FliW
MRIQSQRFGEFEIDPRDIIHFPEGLIGFTEDQKFVLVRHRESSPIGWLQCVTRPDLALPVVSVDALALQDTTIISAARMENGASQKENGPEYAVMAVLCAPPGQRATVNLLAPIVVDVRSHKGAQIILDGTTYSTAEPFALRQNLVQIQGIEAAAAKSAEEAKAGAPTPVTP